MNSIKKSDNYLITGLGNLIGRLIFLILNFLRHSLRGGLLLVTFILVSSCQDKTSGQTSQIGNDTTSVSNDHMGKPTVDIKVNRHYDSAGNLIGYDSTYSSFYSGVEGDPNRLDSAMHDFDTFFKRHHSRDFDREFNLLFFNDSLRHYDFFHKDFFRKRYELNGQYLRGMMQRMDSIKNHFFRRQERIFNDSGKNNSFGDT